MLWLQLITQLKTVNNPIYQERQSNSNILDLNNSPKIKIDNIFDEKSDIWSLGIIFYSLFEEKGKNQFNNEDIYKLL